MFTKLFRRIRRDDDGYALLAVMGIGIVLLLMVAGSLGVATGGFTKARTDDDWNAALSAAYGGLAEYQSRLGNDSTYSQYGNPSAPFSAVSSSTVTLPSGATANPAFGIGASGPWATIPGGTAAYRYEVDNTDYASAGIIHLRVTGRAGDQTRSIVADLRQTGFLDFLYFTDKEVQDPTLRGRPVSDCDTYAWATPARNVATCPIIQFAAADTINGPLHSNDELQICGARFNGPVTTASKLSEPRYYSIPSGCSTTTPTFAVGTGPALKGMLGMPATNLALKEETRVDLDTARPGCMYTGPTQITFNGDGTMTVKSPWTLVTQPSLTQGIPSKSPAALCGKTGTNGNALGSANGATIPVVPSNLVYVQNVPAGTSDPNAWSAGTYPNNFTCFGTSDFPGWTFGGASYPTANEAQPIGTSATNPAYGCRNGDAFVRGGVAGAITVAAENYIYITGNLTYVNSQRDILGLIGNNAVQVWNPRANGGGLVDPSANRTVQAAIMSTAHTFTVQNYTVAPARGTLTVLGAIVQYFRGPVAQSSGGGIGSGFAKNYNYDTRLRSAAPPKFLQPTSTTYAVTQVADVPSAFTAKGWPSDRRYRRGAALRARPGRRLRAGDRLLPQRRGAPRAPPAVRRRARLGVPRLRQRHRRTGQRPGAVLAAARRTMPQLPDGHPRPLPGRRGAHRRRVRGRRRPLPADRRHRRGSARRGPSDPRRVPLPRRDLRGAHRDRPRAAPAAEPHRAARLPRGRRAARHGRCAHRRPRRARHGGRRRRRVLRAAPRARHRPSGRHGHG
ncbi:hypothetical protein GCM10025866_10270 [Naasia aerilata]|uniref:Flp pilus-assembly TadG-like N-terminal domain-containing protein n=1 Tax=Naasia aerilata TaxID=1162966 RepID=A0ABN6XJM0_9MICO|nr:hypothetical protein GCM10025866_10270 [Naasia aerilata]